MMTTTERYAVKSLKLLSLRLWFCLIAILFQFSVFAQERQPDRGFQSNNSYAAQGFDAVNVSNGNVVVNLPIASLPAARGTSPGFTVTLQYNSKLWDSKQINYSNHLMESNENNPPEGYFYSSNVLQLNDRAGWQVLSRYQLLETNHLDTASPDPCNDGLIDEYNARWKLEMYFPDGSVKQFVPVYGATKTQGGYYNINKNGVTYNYAVVRNPVSGTCHISRGDGQFTTSGMTYMSTDGSRLRLFIPYQSTNWKIYSPDGTVVENAPPDDPQVLQRITERNGGSIEIKGNQIVDQLGRSIDINSNGVTVKGVNGESLTTQFVRGSRWVHHEYQAITDTNETVPPGTERSGEVSVEIETIEQVILPDQAGGQSYSFEYYADPTRQYGTNYTNGWGELKSVILPTGAKSTYLYDTTDSGSNYTAFDIVHRQVKERNLIQTELFDGISTLRTETTNYDSGSGNSLVINPDGSISSESAYRSFYGDVWNDGLAFVNYNSDGSKIERIWKQNLPRYSGDSLPYSVKLPRNANAYVKTEFTTIANAANQPSLTAIKDFNYDKNGNVTRIAEYDWVASGSIPRDSGRPTGIPEGAVLKRTTVNQYYNQTPDADSTATSSYTYENPGSPKLKNVLKSSETMDASGSVVARSEFFYDDADNKGNLTETKTWSSQKNGSFQAYSNPLTAANSVSTTAAYNAYGSPVSTTDASGVQTVMTYGAISKPGGTVTDLYPTKVETAANFPALKRTMTMDYDFATGLVTRSTDIDNNLSSETVYDALGRSVTAKSAVGTSQEAWTQTEYHVAEKYVVSKSDLYAKGDGRKVAVQHFDELGRVRLTRTLEDAIVQNAADETQGIKVQTRYAFQNPSDPANSNGAYTLTSNPYRAATAAAAGAEATMGWALTYSDKTGRTSVMKTFDGAALPAEFGGGNTNLTGTVTTNVDANITTVQDQAGKQRRSITNALGQLIRVDEPNAAGLLDAGSNPAQPTNYIYDTLGNMVKVEQGGQSRYFLYDSLGRMLRVRQPEQDVNSNLPPLTEPTSGNNQWTAAFTYDDSGNLLTATDAKGVVITNTYDSISRVTNRSYSVPNTTDPGRVTAATNPVSYFYDGTGLAGGVPQFSKGKLTKVANGISETRYTSFDNMGRVLASEQETDGQIYRMGYSYNLSGALVSERYPSGRIVRNDFDADGDLKKITSQRGGAARTFASDFAYTAAGAISQLKLGNGRWESAQFNNRLQITQLALGATAGDGSLWKLDFDYGELSADGASVDQSKNTGSIARQTIGFNNQAQFVQSFRYDSLDRLSEARETTGAAENWRQTFAYDRFGNRTAFGQTMRQANGTTATLPINNLTLPSVNAANNRFSVNQGYSYDNNGNLIVDAENRRFVFNAENKQVAVKDNNDVTIGSYFYDGDGHRVKKVDRIGEQTVFVYDAMGKLVAEYSNNVAANEQPQTSYVATDTLQSVRAITNQAGEVTSRRDFLPFGEEIMSGTANRTEAAKYKAGIESDKVRQKFTGYQRDDETGLDFAEARYYQNKHGRFTAVDPLLASGKSANPQTFNRYAYVMNNPLRLTDPSGMQAGTYAGKWYMPQTPDGRSGYRYAASQPDGYTEVTQTNKWGQLTGSGAGLPEGYEIKFNPAGPYSFIPRIMIDSTAASGFVSDFAKKGFEIQMTPEAHEKFSASGALYENDHIILAVGVVPALTSAASRALTASTIDEGAATVTASFPNGNMHFSIETQASAGQGLATEMVMNPRSGNAFVREAQFSESVAFDRSLRLPNAQGAIDFQTRSLGNAGRYNYFNNSCLTHVCGVMRAGGLSQPRVAFEASRLTFRAQTSRIFGSQ